MPVAEPGKSEKLVIMWLIYTIVATLACMLLASTVVYFVYDCWPLARYQFESGICLDKTPGYLKALPIVLGIIAGSIVTHLLKDK